MDKPYVKVSLVKLKIRVELLFLRAWNGREYSHVVRPRTTVKSIQQHPLTCSLRAYVLTPLHGGTFHV